MKATIKSFWRLPGVDAKVAIYQHPDDESITVLSFLAKGFAYRKVNGEKKLMPRNPGRLALIEYVLPLLPNAQGVRYGRKDTPIDVNPEEMGVRKLYSKGGNYQFDVVIFTSDIGTNLPEEAFCPAGGWAPELERTTGKAIKPLNLDR